MKNSTDQRQRKLGSERRSVHIGAGGLMYLAGVRGSAGLAKADAAMRETFSGSTTT